MHEPQQPRTHPQVSLQRQSKRCLACWSLLFLLGIALQACGGPSGRAPQVPGKAQGTPPAIAFDPNQMNTSGDNTAAYGNKVDSIYVQFFNVLHSSGSKAAEQFATDNGMLGKQGQIRFQVTLDSKNIGVIAGTSFSLLKLGARIHGASRGSIVVFVPIKTLLKDEKKNKQHDFLAQVLSIKHVIGIHRAQRVRFQDGWSAANELQQLPLASDPRLSQGVQRTGADRWQAAGITGKGVKIGILDGGFQNYQQLLGSGLPQQVTVKSFTQDGDIGGGSQHGTAVAEIVHDMAPDAELFLANYDLSESWQPAVAWLAQQGVKIITSSTGFEIGQRNGTGDEEQMIDQLHRQGIIYFNASGNEGLGHYAGTFTPDSRNFNQFAQGQPYLPLSAFAPAPEGFSISLQWDDFSSNGQEQYDLFLIDQKGRRVASSANPRQAGAPPEQVIEFANPKERAYAVVIRGTHVTRPGKLELFMNNAEFDGSQPLGSLTIPADGHTVVAVGAADVKTDQLENFSSSGPTTDNRQKPELLGVDDTQSQTNINPFFGTSAATPHVAGAAALILSAFPNFGPDDILNYLQKNAANGSGGTPNQRSGYGRLQLGPAPSGGNQPVASNPATQTTPAASAGSNSPGFTDDFSNSTSGLPNKNGVLQSTRYETTLKRYLISVRLPNSDELPVYSGRHYNDFTAQVTAQPLNGSEAIYGFVFRATSSNSFLIYQVDTSGQYALFRISSGSVDTLIPTTSSQSIQSNGPNVLKVVAQGNTISLYANGTKLTDANADPGNGLIGFAVSSGSSGLASVAFSQFNVQ